MLKLATGATITKDEAGYVDHPVDGQRCGRCTMFVSPDECTLVEGGIAPNGYCRFWEGEDEARKYSDDQPRDERGRWTDGGGGTAAEGTSSGEKYEHDAASISRMETTAKEVASELGYDSNKIVMSNETPHFELNGKQLETAGVANLKTGEITLYSFANDGSTIGGVAAHEVEHQIFQTALNAYNKGDREVSAKLQPYLYNRGGQNRLQKEDGVTDYSREHWAVFGQAQQASGRTFDALHAPLREVAIHETLAEMSRVSYETGRLTGSQTWKGLYGAVRESYGILQSRRK